MWKSFQQRQHQPEAFAGLNRLRAPNYLAEVLVFESLYTSSLAGPSKYEI